MFKIKIENLTANDFDILRLNYDADIDEVIIFDDYEEFYSFCEVIGFFKAWKIVWEYGLNDAQYIADSLAIEKPLENIEALASYILQDVLEKYLEEYREE